MTVSFADPGQARAGPAGSGEGRLPSAQVVYACSHEGALRLEDMLARRTRMAIETRDCGVAAAPEAAVLMAAELGWSDEQTAAGLARYRAVVEAQLAAKSADDDAGAFEALSAVPGGAALRL